MSKIKKFFSRKKEEAAFKLKLGGAFGQGHALNAPTSEPTTSQRKPLCDAYVPPKRSEVSAEARAAAAAALARFDKKDTSNFNVSLAAIKAQAKRELEAERKTKQPNSTQSTSSESVVSAASSSVNNKLACQAVYFRCPLISDEVLPKKEWKDKIRAFLYDQLEADKALTAALMIYSLNVKEKAEDCIETITKYLENIINHPEEEKYCKIRMSNKVFSDKVRYVEGAVHFLNAAGFQETDIDGESFLVWYKNQIEKDFDLPTLLEALKNAEPIGLQLDRNIKVLLPSQAKRVELPNDFYRISPEEIKREQQLRTDAIESAQILKTKAMREREEQRILRMYRYALVRVKFANGIYIQGTFNVYEKVSDLYEFVQSCLLDESLEFNLIEPTEGKLTDEDFGKTLYEMRFIPNILLLFTLPDTVAEAADTNFLKEELLMLVQSM